LELSELTEKLKADKKSYKTELLSVQTNCQQLESDIADKENDSEDLSIKLETQKKLLKKLQDEKLSLTTQLTQSKEKVEGAKKTIAE
jgi:chromosome segregation ATPase